MSAPSAGTYDPVPAAVYRPVYSQSGHEPVESGPTLVCSPYIRFRPRDSREILQQGKTDSVTAVYIRVRDYDGTRLITTDCYLIHRSQRYDFVGVNPISYLDHELEFIMQSLGKTA